MKSIFITLMLGLTHFAQAKLVGCDKGIDSGYYSITVAFSKPQEFLPFKSNAEGHFWLYTKKSPETLRHLSSFKVGKVVKINKGDTGDNGRDDGKDNSDGERYYLYGSSSSQVNYLNLSAYDLKYSNDVTAYCSPLVSVQISSLYEIEENEADLAISDSEENKENESELRDGINLNRNQVQSE